MKREIELLAPAKNIEYGIEAINCGADAVYIGATRFGARYAAGNSVEDIARLVEYAHQFGVKVYVTLNTILYEEELDEARQLAWDLCGVGVDAFIIQDMAYLTFGLPIQLHASTQTSANTLDRVKFIEGVGFDRVVLERSLSAVEVESICRNTTIEIEAFVHGAICVSNSGECYMGHIVSGRSGNRGVCSQPCRSTYNLYDGNGRVLERDKHLLSVKDLMLCDHLPQMIQLGVSSLKIEGRLKDISYLKSTTIYYRREIDSFLKDNPQFCRSSHGESVSNIEIDLNRSFTRGFSDYFWCGKSVKIGSFDTGKSIGEFVGRVKSCSKDFFTLDGDFEFGNGDGVCFVASDGIFRGTNINSCQNGRVFPNRMDGISVGVNIYRNFDIKYTSNITTHKVLRKILVEITITFSEIGVLVSGEDICGNRVLRKYDNGVFCTADNPQKSIEMLKTQLSKSGDTIFSVKDIIINGDAMFAPASVINSIRREILEDLKNKRLSSYQIAAPKERKAWKVNNLEVSYKANVSNSLAEQVYLNHGYGPVEKAVELSTKSFEGIEAMTMRYCLRKELGRCLLDGGDKGRLFLENGGNFFELVNDCSRCVAKLIYKGRKI